MKRNRFWVLISIMMALALIFVVCQADGNGNDNGTGTGPGNGNGTDNGGPPPTKFEQDPNDAMGGVPYNITNNFGQDSSTSLIVQWHNYNNVFVQALQLVEENEDFEEAGAVLVGGIDWIPTRLTGSDVGNYTARFIFRQEIYGLKPATKYKYRMGSPGYWSDTFYHLTSGGSNTDFSFTVGADSQDENFNGEESIQNTFRAANAYDSDNRFFLVAGDIVDYPQIRPEEFVNYTNVANEFNKNTPIAVTQGNHDTYLVNPSSDRYVFGSAEVFNAFVTFPNNGWARQEGQANAGPHRSDSYYFYYNKVLIIMLNTMATENATGTADPNHNAQANWLRAVLQNDKDKNSSKYIIVVTHVPPFSIRGVERWLTSAVRQFYAPIMSEFDVDIFFAGHDHVYTRSNPIKVMKTGTGVHSSAIPLAGIDFNTAENGTIYSVASSVGPKFYTMATDAVIGQYYPTRVDNQKPGVFINVKVTDENLTVTAIKVGTSTPIDTYTVPAKR